MYWAYIWFDIKEKALFEIPVCTVFTKNEPMLLQVYDKPRFFITIAEGE